MNKFIIFKNIIMSKKITIFLVSLLFTFFSASTVLADANFGGNQWLASGMKIYFGTSTSFIGSTLYTGTSSNAVYSTVTGMAGNASVATLAQTASSLASTVACTAGQFATGIATSGAAICSTPTSSLGSLSSNYLPKSNGTTLVNSILYDNGNLGVGTTNPSFKLDVAGISNFNSGLNSQNWATVIVVPINNGAGTIERETTPNRSMRLLQYQNGGIYGGGISWGMAPKSDGTWLNGAWSSGQYLLAYDGGTLQIQGSNQSGGTSTPFTPTSFLTVANSGNIGVGITNPGAKLDVYESPINLSGTTGAAHGLLINRGSAITTSGTQSSIFTEWNGLGNAESLTARAYSYKLQNYDGTNWLAINNSGNLAVGTTTFANAKVTIVPNGQSYAIDAGGYRIGNIGLPTANSDAATKAYVDGLGTGGTLWNGTTTGNIWNVNSGNVGIGVTNPNASLHIVSSAPVLRLSNTSSISSAGTTLAQIDLTDNYQGSGAEGRIAAVRGSTGSGGTNPADLVFSTMNNGTVLNEAMRIRYSGNVGIGTTNPLSLLQVNGTNSVGKITLANSQPTVLAGDNMGQIDFYTYDVSSLTDRVVASVKTIADRDYTGTDAGSSLAFSTHDMSASAERMRITGAGNVGIGTTNPGAKFDIVGAGESARFESSANDVWTTYIPQTGNIWRVQAQTGGNFGIYDQTNSAFRLSINNTGNVGIGTTNPGALLEITPSSGTYSILAGNKRIGNVDTPVSNSDAATLGWVNSAIASATSSVNSSSLWSGTKNGSIWNGTSGSGNVGVGLTNPAFKLDVNGTANISSTLTQSGGIAYLGNYNLAGTNYPRSGNDLAIAWNWTNGSRDMSFWNTDVAATVAFSFKQLLGASSKSDLLTIFSNGNVGIGTSNPGSALEVNGGIGSINANPLWFLGPANGTVNSTNYHTIGYAAGANYHVTGSAAGDLTIGARPTGKIIFGTNSSAATPVARMTINNTGNIGIGTTNPGQKLEVNGTIYANNANGVLVPDVSSSGGRSIYTDSNNGYAIINWANNSWFRNSSNTWTFQGGTGGDDWTQTAQLYLNTVGTAGANDKLIELGQRQSNTTAGDYKGLRVVQYTGSSIQDGYFQAGNASFSGTVNIGSISLNPGTNKITAGTFDPVYTINNQHYATYLPGMTGVKEETAATLTLNCVKRNCSQTIDFNNLPVASDLWLFTQATNLTKNFDQLSVLLSSGFKGSVWYDKNEAKKTVTINALAADSALKTVEVSYRLTAPRFDSADWSNLSHDDIEGFNLDKLLK